MGFRSRSSAAWDERTTTSAAASASRAAPSGPTTQIPTAAAAIADDPELLRALLLGSERPDRDAERLGGAAGGAERVPADQDHLHPPAQRTHAPADAGKQCAVETQRPIQIEHDARQPERAIGQRHAHPVASHPRVHRRARAR